MARTSSNESYQYEASTIRPMALLTGVMFWYLWCVRFLFVISEEITTLLIEREKKIQPISRDAWESSGLSSVLYLSKQDVMNDQN